MIYAHVSVTSDNGHYAEYDANEGDAAEAGAGRRRANNDRKTLRITCGRDTKSCPLGGMNPNERTFHYLCYGEYIK